MSMKSQLPLKLSFGRGHSPLFFPVFYPVLRALAGGRESCKQIATLNPRPGSAERPGSLCLQGSLKCVESGEGEHPDGGPPGPRPPPGAASAQPGRRAWALALCTPLLFMFTEKERERRERSLWLPSSDHKYCKLQMAAPLPNSAHTASPDAMERAGPAALTTCTPLPTTPGEGRDGECCPALLPKPPSRQGHPQRGAGWGRICAEGSRALLVLKRWAPLEGSRSLSLTRSGVATAC